MSDRKPSKRNTFRWYVLSLIKMISLIVPRRFRSAWHQEWVAEINHRWSQLHEWRQVNAGTKANLLKRSLGAFWDALSFQPHRWEDEIIQDLRYGVRTLVKNPGFSFVAILSLTLGIGANTAIFTLVDTTILRPLPYADPDRLFIIRQVNLQKGNSTTVTSMEDFVAWKGQNQVFERLATFMPGSSMLTGRGEPEELSLEYYSVDMLPMLGVQPLIGRNFGSEEDKPGGPPVAIISHGLWESLFANSTDIIGKTLNLDHQPFTIIGVMPAGFRNLGQGHCDLWLPSSFDVDQGGARQKRTVQVYARIKAGVAPQEADAFLEAISHGLAQQYPETNAGLIAKLFSLDHQMRGDVRQEFLLLLGAVGFVLLIACTNVAVLLLTRNNRRRKELAVRAALGAGRLRLIRQLLLESLLLSICGGLAGLLVATLMIKPLTILVSQSIFKIEDATIDKRVLVFTLLVSLLTGLGFGVVPAILCSGTDLNKSIKEGSGGAGTGFRHNLCGNVLAIIEVALSLVLLIGAGLMIKSYLVLRPTSPGFDAGNKLTFKIFLPKAKYPTDRHTSDFLNELLLRLGQLPEATSVAAASALPFSGIDLMNFSIDGVAADIRSRSRTYYAAITPNYFRAMGTPLISGRDFADTDNQSSPQVLIINETMSRKFWPNENPLGKQITLNRSAKAEQAQVVGVVKDQNFLSLHVTASPQFFAPLSQSPSMFFNIILSTSSDPMRLAAVVRQQVHAIDKDQPIRNLQTFENVLYESTSYSRSYAMLLGSFSAIALVLAIIGIYGVISYSVSQRSHEMSIRMAIGANPSDVLSLIVRQGMLLAMIGVVLGVGAAIGLTRYMSSVLYGVSVTDPKTFVLIATLLTLASLLACLVPARRATRVDPLSVLRSE